MRTRPYAAALLALLGGCHHAPTVIQTGPNTYMAGASSHSGFKSDLAVTAAAMKQANAFCAKQGKVPQMTGNQSTNSPVFTSQNAQVAFTCVAPAPPDPPASAAK
jgi:hypothetical protein